MSQNTLATPPLHFPIGKVSTVKDAVRRLLFVLTALLLGFGFLYLVTDWLLVTTTIPHPPVNGTLTPPGVYVASGEVMTRAINSEGHSLNQPDTILIPLKVGQPYTLYAWGTYQYCPRCDKGPIGNAINGEGLDIFNVDKLRLVDTYTQPPFDNTNILVVYSFIASAKPLELAIQGSESLDYGGGIFYQLYQGFYE